MPVPCEADIEILIITIVNKIINSRMNSVDPIAEISGLVYNIRFRTLLVLVSFTLGPRCSWRNCRFGKLAYFPVHVRRAFLLEV